MDILVTRVVVTIILFLVGWLVWTQPVSWRVMWKQWFQANVPIENEVIIPALDCKIDGVKNSYAEGLNVDGVIWKNDYEEFRLYVRNVSKKAEIFDVRINMDLPGGVVQYKLLSEAGCSGLKIKDNDTVGGGLGMKDGVIVKTVKQYSNNLYITADKFFPESFFNVRLVLKGALSVSGDPHADEAGVIEINYRFLNAEKAYEVKAERFRIYHKQGGGLYIDLKNPLKGNVLRSMAIVFDEPVTLGPGRQSYESPNVTKQ